MSNEPYRQTFTDEDGNLCFYAELPAFAHIGVRYDELSEDNFKKSFPGYKGDGDMTPVLGQIQNQLQNQMEQLAERMKARQGARQEQAAKLDESQPSMGALQDFAFNMLQSLMGMGAGKPPDPASMLDATRKQMDAFRQSPLFDEANDSYRKMEEHLEQIRDSNPELAQRALDDMNKMREFMNDPKSEFEKAQAALSNDCDAEDDDDAESGEEAAPAGHVKFSCGSRKNVMPEQIALFEQLRENQEKLRPQIEAALRELCDQVGEPGGPAIRGDGSSSPGGSESADIPLNSFRFNYVGLDPQHQGRVFVSLDSQFGHFDEHGCYLLIKGDKLERYGEFDTVFSDDPDGDGDLDDEDDDEF